MAEGTVNLYNPHDGLTGRDGGPYLDQEERRLAEIRRAAVEGREPDLDNPPATAGTPLVTAGQLVQMANPTSIPSQTAVNPEEQGLEKLAKDESFLVTPFSQRERTDAEAAALRAEQENPVTSNPAHPANVSHDAKDEDNVSDGHTASDSGHTPTLDFGEGPAVSEPTTPKKSGK